jgi:prevent-host-death family protein
MKFMSTKAAKRTFAELVNRVGYGRERITITRRGRPLAVLVPVADVNGTEMPDMPASTDSRNA